VRPWPHRLDSIRPWGRMRPVSQGNRMPSRIEHGSTEMDRRTFVKLSGGAIAAGVAPARAAIAEIHEAAQATADPVPYPVQWYRFTRPPDSDACWSLSVGPDGRIYAAACAESVPGGVVKPVRYNEQRDDLNYLFNLADKVDDPGDSGRASQCK